MENTKEQIKTRIKTERGRYERARRKIYEFYKHTGNIGRYYMMKQIRNNMRIQPKIDEALRSMNVWQKIYITINLFFRRIWRNLFG